MSDNRTWESIEDEYRRLVLFHDRIEALYHDSIGDHISTISIHDIGDELAKCGDIKEVQIIG